MNVHDEFTRRVAEDRLCAAVMKAVRDGDTAALGRLGMRGFAQYAGRLSELMTECAQRRLLGADDFGAIMDEDEDEDDFGAIMDEDEDDFGAIMDEDEDDFGAIMNEVAKPAHYAHHLVNEGGTAIQQALDRRNGVRLRVIEPEFNDGRLKGIVGEASESDSENAADNLATQLGTFVKDMGNEFMRQNAEQRDRAGFKVTVTRTGGAKCCPWCADRTGKWELANAPDGVFGCHDNCKCMVDYTNSKGTVRGRAVTHKIDGKTVTKWEFADKIPYTPPKVLTKEEAAARGAFDKPKRLTGGANGGIIGLASNAHSRNRELEETIKRCINQEKPVFADDLAKYFKNIPPEKGKYIMALHGSAKSGYIYGYEIDARTLANIVKSRKDYNGEDEIVLISCNTGSEDVKKCFAQEFAAAMGVRIHAPTHYGAISPWGSYYSSDKKGKRLGKFKPFDPKKGDDDT